MTALTSTFPRPALPGLQALSPLALALTVAGALCLASLLIDGVKAQADAVRGRTEAQATSSLAQAGFPWARLQIDNDLGHVLGEAPNDAARAQAMQAANRLLAPAMGWPGVFARLEDGQRVAASPPREMPMPALGGMPDAVAMVAERTAAADLASRCKAALDEAQRDQRIVFDSGAVEPTVSSLQLLDRLAPRVLACPGVPLDVQGHSDAVGAQLQNQHLSLRRAQAVVAALTARGVPAAQLRAEGLGDSQRLDRADTPQAHSRNRRIEFHWATVPVR